MFIQCQCKRNIPRPRLYLGADNNRFSPPRPHPNWVFDSSNNKWNAPKGYCFIKPIKSNNIIEKEVPLRGIIKYVDKQLIDIQKEDLVGFTPSSEYEFVVDGERLYRVLTNEISIKYERQGHEEEYNPSWA